MLLTQKTQQEQKCKAEGIQKIRTHVAPPANKTTNDLLLALRNANKAILEPPSPVLYEERK